MSNLVIKSIPADTLADALKRISEARALLAPHLVPLNTDERAALPKMGDRSVTFVSKAAEYAQAMPKLMPQYLDVDGLVVDAGVNADLLPVFQELNGFTTDVESTRMQAGSEGYTGALVVYSACKLGADNNQPGAAAAVAELETRFAGQGRRKAAKQPA